MTTFVNTFFCKALKDNIFLERCLLTGILRISNDSLLSGLNNITIYTLLDYQYNTCFGFNENELSDLLRKSNLIAFANNIKKCFNGYKIGGLLVYNPWSVLSCLNRMGEFRVYWINTNDNKLIEQKLITASSEVKLKIQDLLRGQLIEVNIDENVCFENLDLNDASFWSILLFSGFLTYETKDYKNTFFECKIKIPNYEILQFYSRLYVSWFFKLFDKNLQYESFLKNLIKGDVFSFVKDLSSFLRHSVSYFDTDNKEKNEGFYHGFILGLLSSLIETHDVKSNKESGYGRYDVLIIPKKSKFKAMILEFKFSKSENDLENLSKKALDQIDQNFYETELSQYSHIKEVMKCGIAFSDKKVKAAFKTTNLSDMYSNSLVLTPEYSSI